MKNLLLMNKNTIKRCLFEIFIYLYMNNYTYATETKNAK